MYAPAPSPASEDARAVGSPLSPVQKAELGLNQIQTPRDKAWPFLIAEREGQV